MPQQNQLVYLNVSECDLYEALDWIPLIQAGCIFDLEKKDKYLTLLWPFSW